jgi:hypothetical protein
VQDRMAACHFADEFLASGFPETGRMPAIAAGRAADNVSHPGPAGNPPKESV